jgi:hypothetical protein
MDHHKITNHKSQKFCDDHFVIFVIGINYRHSLPPHIEPAATLKHISNTPNQSGQQQR